MRISRHIEHLLDVLVLKFQLLEEKKNLLNRKPSISLSLINVVSINAHKDFGTIPRK